jgi:retinol dehydrogenase 14
VARDIQGGTGFGPSGRVAVITGAASGIGREIALGLAARGATTVVVARGTDRAAAAAREIATATGCDRVESIGVTDLALMSDVRRLASELLDRYPRIHIVVNNAGAYFHRREVTSEGIERTFALNVLAPFLLTSLLAQRLVESAPARVVNIASAAHRGYSLDLSDLQGSQRYAGYRAYGRSKLELILLTREFARRLRGSGVTVNAVHPGFIRSGFGQNNGGGTAFGIRLLARLFARSLAEGADTPLWVATDPTVPGTTGEYFANRRVGGASRRSYDMASARELFQICQKLTGAPELAETPSPELRRIQAVPVAIRVPS